MSRRPGAFDPVYKEKPIKFHEVYEKFSDLDGTNKSYKGRFEYGFGDKFKIAQEKVAENRQKMNQGDALDLFIQDRGVATMEKVFGGMSFKPETGITVERGSLSELAVRGQDILSVKTRIIDRCIQKADDYYLSSKIGDIYKKELYAMEAKQKELLPKDSATLSEMTRKGEMPDDLLLRRLLLNGFRYRIGESTLPKPVRQRFYELARERQAEMLKSAMEKASPRAREQFQRMLDDLNDKRLTYGKDKPDGLGRKFLSKVSEKLLDIGLEELENKLKEELGNIRFFAANSFLPVLGPADPHATRSKPSSSELDVYEWTIEGYEKRGLTPPSYDDLKSGEKQLQNIMKTLKEWLMADGKTFWREFRPQVTSEPEAADSNDTKLTTVAIDLGEQILMLQIHLLWAERVDSGKHPWLWEVASDKTELVTELSNKYLKEGPDAMYNFIGDYSYHGKRPLSRYVACSVINEALENVLASVTSVDAGGVHADMNDN